MACYRYTRSGIRVLTKIECEVLPRGTQKWVFSMPAIEGMAGFVEIVSARSGGVPATRDARLLIYLRWADAATSLFPWPEKDRVELARAMAHLLSEFPQGRKRRKAKLAIHKALDAMGLPRSILERF